MALCRSGPPASRVQRAIAVSEVAPQSDQLIQFRKIALTAPERSSEQRKPEVRSSAEVADRTFRLA